MKMYNQNIKTSFFGQCLLHIGIIIVQFLICGNLEWLVHQVECTNVSTTIWYLQKKQFCVSTLGMSSICGLLSHPFSLKKYAILISFKLDLKSPNYDSIPIFTTTFTTQKLSIFNNFKRSPLLGGSKLVTYEYSIQTLWLIYKDFIGENIG